MLRIENEKNIANIRRNIYFSFGLLLVSLAGFFLISQIFYAQASESGFFSFSNLILSDLSAVSHNFNDFIISLVESLPAVSFGLIILLGGLSLLSIKILKHSIVNLRLISRT